jgi:hypothetical protein
VLVFWGHTDRQQDPAVVRVEADNARYQDWTPGFWRRGDLGFDLCGCTARLRRRVLGLDLYGRTGRLQRRLLGLDLYGCIARLRRQVLGLDFRRRIASCGPVCWLSRAAMVSSGGDAGGGVMAAAKASLVKRVELSRRRTGYRGGVGAYGL